MSSKKYYEENKEAVNERNKKYYEENKEAVNERCKKYYWENKEALSEHRQKYYWKNPEVFKERSRKYYWENKEAVIKQNKKYRQENPETWMTSGAKKRAENKNIPFNINKEYVKKIWPKDNKCPALNIEFNRGVKKTIDSSPSLDRIVPELGYIKGNVQIISMLANRIMTSATPEQVMSVAKYYEKITEGVDNEEKI